MHFFVFLHTDIQIQPCSETFSEKYTFVGPSICPLDYEVPLVLFPQTNEQWGVANRVSQLGAGKLLKNNSAKAIRDTLEEVLGQSSYKEQATNISKGFKSCGGAKQAAQFIIEQIH